MWKLNQFIPDDDGEREESLLEEESDGICSLSPTQRMYAFAASLAAGLILMFLSLIVFAKPIKFALLFTFGNVLAVGSTAFLIGPGRQLAEWVNLKSFLPLFVPSDELSFLVLSFLCCLSEELLSLFHKFTKISVKVKS
ncbi:hypothetical protein D5086_027836 [Populus alba]|uniref:Uncharacterized protein n=1 Tax=Populus alba TaxID=43335 RepID=A0ACC4AWP7_POPAL